MHSGCARAEETTVQATNNADEPENLRRFNHCILKIAGAVRVGRDTVFKEYPYSVLVWLISVAL
jgi:hypothetical protein